MNIYLVTISDKYPAAGEHPHGYEIEASNKKEAISKARKMLGWRSRYDSPVVFKAEKIS